MRLLFAAFLVCLAPTVAFAQDPYYGNYPPQEAQAYQYGFVGPHPEPYDYGNAPCYQTGAHFHPYPPFDQYLFRQSNGYFYFVGDLGDFGFSGQLWGYNGNHPFPVEYGGGFCYIGWPHRHHFPAPASMPFRWSGGYYVYAGGWDPGYYANQAAWNAYYNGYYRSSYYGGRYWSVRPPHVYRGNWGYGMPGVYRPGVTVVGPSGGSITVGPRYGGYGGYGGGGVVVTPPGRPYGGGGVVVSPPGRPYVAPAPTYVAPPPSRPTVVGPPPPARAPTYVAPPPQRPQGGGVIIPPPR
jgi:hypothetical protein